MQAISKKSFTVRQAVLYFLSMATTPAAKRIAERKLRDKQARRAQIIRAARRIAELEGWSNVTVRRLADEISYSQPVLYAHFGSRERILDAVAIEGFQELGLAIEKARKRNCFGRASIVSPSSPEPSDFRPAVRKSAGGRSSSSSLSQNETAQVVKAR
jgi:AcrR family transcriptional regulator